MELKLEILKRVDKVKVWNRRQTNVILWLEDKRNWNWKVVLCLSFKWGLDKKKGDEECEYEMWENLYSCGSHNRGTPTSGSALQEGVLIFQKEFHEGKFNITASRGQTDRWRKRCEVEQLNICTDILSTFWNLEKNFCSYKEWRFFIWTAVPLWRSRLKFSDVCVINWGFLSRKISPWI
jgi:hypothetical protein